MAEEGKNEVADKYSHVVIRNGTSLLHTNK